MESVLHLLGIRHHGPGSARSVVQALEALSPDVILLEGPPDAQEILALAAANMTPPVALLVYRPEEARQAVYYPFAEFSPEWQTIQYGLRKNIPIRFMDLPQSRRLAMQEAARAKEKEAAQESERPKESAPEPEVEKSDQKSDLKRDPMKYIAQAAGFEDSERWWEHQFETRFQDKEVFTAVLELMTELRQEVDKEFPIEPMEAAREAHMRQTLRAAQKEGFQKIAVVLGAWHAPALLNMPTAARDKEILQALPKCKTTATWVPWTYGRLLYESGYGAGIESPGYYGHLWENRHSSEFTVRWMTKVAHLLRAEDLESSTASIIESSRLADTLAALRGRPIPGLAEFNEAARAIFCFGESSPLQLVRRKLVVGERLGTIPPEMPEIPIQADLRQTQRRLRLAGEADERILELDLRKENDLERSHLLHRLRLLNISWGKPERATGKGTFREVWRLRWDPEFEIRLIEASIWGNSVPAATEGKVLDLARRCRDLPELAAIMQDVFLAHLPRIIPSLVEALQNLAAVSSDVSHLMAALPPVAEIFRYGSVRQSETESLGIFVRGVVARICIGLPSACASLGDEAAQEMVTRLNATHTAIINLQEQELSDSWKKVLARLVDASSMHGLVAGRCCRLSLDAGWITPEEAGRRLGHAVSPAATAAQTAAWVEGFLTGSGLLLLHNPALWSLIDSWINSLPADSFLETLPLLRRTFSTFPMGERRQMSQLAIRPGTGVKTAAAQSGTRENFCNETRADLVLPLVRQILGLSSGAERINKEISS